MRTILVGILLAVVCVGSVKAQDQGIPTGPPAAFLNSMPQTGPLHLVFCLIGDHVCISQTAQIWGQVCDSEAAKTAVDDRDYTFPMPGLHYAGWRCSDRFHDKSEHVFGGGNWGD